MSDKSINLFNELTTAGFRTHKHREDWQYMFVRYLVEEYTEFAQQLIENKIQFDWQQDFEGNVELGRNKHGELAFLTGQQAIHLKQQPSSNTSTFPIAIRCIALILKEEWEKYLHCEWKDVIEQYGLGEDNFEHTYFIMTYPTYHNYVGHVSAGSYLYVDMKYKDKTSESGIFREDEDTYRFDVPVTESLLESLLEFQLVAYDKGVCNFEDIDCYIGCIGEPTIPQCEDGDFDGYTELYVGGRMSGVTI